MCRTCIFFFVEFASFTKFFVLGIQHIIPKGLDHILFIFGLFLFSSSLNKLIKQITIFTIAHSITFIFVSLFMLFKLETSSCLI